MLYIILYILFYILYMYINEIYFGFFQTLGDFEGLGETEI